MLKGPGPSPHVRYGQGKTACTILTEDGCIYPVVSSLSYNDRTKSAPYQHGRGVRAMHRSTLTLTKPPWSPAEEFKTTNKQVHMQICKLIRLLKNFHLKSHSEKKMMILLSIIRIQYDMLFKTLYCHVVDFLNIYPPVNSKFTI